MQREATDVLPKLLDAIGFRRGILLGHSDGATDRGLLRRQRAGSSRARAGPDGAALLHGGDGHRRDQEDRRDATRPPICARGSRAITPTSMPRSAAGASAWLDPRIRSKFDTTDALAYIRVPVLVIQGAADPTARSRRCASRGGMLLPGRDAGDAEASAMRRIGRSRTKRSARSRRSPTGCSACTTKALKALHNYHYHLLH